MKVKCLTHVVALSMAALALSANAEVQRVKVSIENVSPDRGTFLTPMWVGLHDGQAFDTYDGNTPASNDPIQGSNALESLCEDGSTAQISSDFEQLQPLGAHATVLGSALTEGPIDPGEITSQTFLIDANGPNKYFSYASMIIPSNDFCIANGNPRAHRIFDENGQFVAQSFFVAGSEALDAGTEVNDELPQNTAFFGQSAPNTGIDENGVIGTIGSDLAEVGFQAPNDRNGTPNILATARFSEANFLAPGYSFVKFSFSAAPAITETLHFKSVVNSAQEVPQNSSKAQAFAWLKLIDNGEKLKFKMKAFGLNNVTAAHLHIGEPGANGEVAVNLLQDDAHKIQYGNRLKKLAVTFDSDDLVGSFQGKPLDALVAEMTAGNVYINIHTDQVPSGEIRGQVYLK